FGMKCPAAAGDAANARRRWLPGVLFIKLWHLDRALCQALITPGCMPGEKLAAIERSYRRTALPFPHPTGWGNSFWRRRDVA
ncbi:hypothetical protein WG8_1233, partial [Paenibacillus sp. Aloe-11]